MMTEDDHAPGGDARAGKRHRFITEQRFTGEHRNNIADNTETQQNKNINRRVRIEPEHVLVEQNLPP